MSNWREQLSQDQEAKAIATWFEDNYHIPVLLVLVAVVFWNRVKGWSNFIVDGEVFYRGNDPWYHERMTKYTVENFPSTMSFDPWTFFPIGTSPEQFGTIFNQLIALVALVLGLGNPSDELVEFLFLTSPAVVAVFICVPAYIIGRRLGGRVGGLVSVGVIAFVPDRLMLFSLAGSVDHHVMEVLLMSLSVLGVMVALTVAEKERPAYELIRAREFGVLRGTIGWSMLAGVAMGVYMWTWPPGVWIFGILAVFFIVHMSIEHVRKRSPEHAAFVGVVSIATASLLQLSTVRTLDIQVTSRSLLQPGLGLAVVAGILFLAWLSREFDSRDLSRTLYPAAVAGSIAVSAILMALLVPTLFDFLISQIDRVLGFVTSPGSTAGTIGEARPMEFSQIRDQYHFAIFTAGIGAAILLAKQFLDDEPKGEHLLIVVWAAFILIASLTQLRFSYYITVAVGGLNAAFVGFIINMIGIPDREFEIQTYQVLVVSLIVLVMFAPLLGLPLIGAGSPTWDVASNASQPGDVLGWADSLEWMSNNTPQPGQYANPDGEPMEYFGNFEQTDDYEYGAGAYGVLSWWDYGHWITNEGERIPTANPFQEGADDAARFLLAQDEDEALDVLSDIQDGEDAQTRFVMIDWKMVETEGGAGGKFFAPPEFHPEWNGSDFYKRLAQFGEEGGFQTLARVQNQEYYKSMVTRLYHYHGSAQQPQPIVVEWTGQEQVFESGPLEGSAYIEAPADGRAVQLFDNMSAAREYVENNPSAQIGGIGGLPSERVEGLEHFRLVHADEVTAIPQSPETRQLSQKGVRFTQQLVAQRNVWNTGLGQSLMEDLARQNTNASEQQLRQQATARGLNTIYPTTPSWTKTFERVDGATIQGTGPANERIDIQVQLEPDNGQPFTYARQVVTDENGNFELTVPYATMGYDEWGPEEGYTNHSVRASGPYSFRTGINRNEDGNITFWQGQANVTEGQVIGEDPEPVTVELQQQELGFNEGQDGSGNETDSNDETESDSGQDSSDGEDDSSPQTSDETSDDNNHLRVTPRAPAGSPIPT